MLGGRRILQPEPARQPYQVRNLTPNPSTTSLHSGLGQSISASSLRSVGSETAPGAKAPPPSSSAGVLSRGEALQVTSGIRAAALKNIIEVQGARPGPGPGPPHVVQQQQVFAVRDPYARNPSTGSLSGQIAGRQSSREASSAPTWIIEEVIDFGQPIDEGVQEVGNIQEDCQNMCKPRHERPAFYNFNLFDSCLNTMCYDGIHQKDAY
eukprot:CAMPEP_0170628146 /NCGR_PEP_ID=MMETSP0224-20130122/32476_1 /TAXON_ID=285029 /ORGANISM="Togula jolla, Strain CCCM 725" /LENGTH=208 /DNA_ID=CAMNT_0010955447 /DNA_START=114 /DNA_END=737 /DNA_ORIENTATION=+